MIDYLGIWHEEKDYSNYPDELWTDYDCMAVWIRGQNYEPKTSMNHLIDMIFIHYDGECEEQDKKFDVYECMEYVRASGGIEVFDYEV